MILSSHILSEVQAVCKTIMIITKGKLVACDTPENLEKRFAGKVNIQLAVEAQPKEATQILAGIPGVLKSTVDSCEDGVCRLTVEPKGVADESLCKEVFLAFAAENKAILQLKMEKVTLEDIFIRLTGENGGADKV